MFSVKIICESIHQFDVLPAIGRLKMLLPGVPQANFLSVTALSETHFEAKFYVNPNVASDHQSMIQKIQATLDGMSPHPSLFQVIEFKHGNSAHWEQVGNSFSFTM